MTAPHAFLFFYESNILVKLISRWFSPGYGAKEQTENSHSYLGPNFFATV